MYTGIRKVEKWVLILACVILSGLTLLVSFGCDRETTGPEPVAKVSPAIVDGAPDVDPGFEIVSQSDCKQSWGEAATDDLPLNQTGVYWEYDGNGNLTLHHVNAGFNCCPELVCELDLTGRVITVIERDEGQCFCLCLMDVDYSITGIPNGKYLLRFDEHVNIGDDPPLEGEITLKGVGSSGEITVERTVYPWEPETPPVWGEFVGFHGCGVLNTEVPVPDYLLGRYLFTWEYDQAGLLKLGQHNAFINCCMEDLQVTFEFSDDLIVIEEVDPLPYICPCFCPFGGELEIHNLPVGEYTFQVHDPFYEPVLQFTVDLAAQPMGYFAPFVGAD